MGVEENLRLMQTLDNAWNGKDWETFMKRHSENVAVNWPSQRGDVTRIITKLLNSSRHLTIISITIRTRSSSATATTRVQWPDGQARTLDRSRARMAA